MHFLLKRSRNAVECFDIQMQYKIVARNLLQVKEGLYVLEIRKLTHILNFMVTPCINNIQHFIFQVMHTTLKKQSY